MVNLVFGEGEVSISNENKIIYSNELLNDFDFLIFLDSRGMTINIDGYADTFLFKTISLLDEKNYSYIVISRPKNLTIFATLYNFLKLNNHLKFKNLITNLGFVDFTPKKEENTQDKLLQIEQFSSIKNKILQVDEYELSDGKLDILKSIEYSEDYISELMSCLDEKFERLYFMNTPIIPFEVITERKRPKSFFTLLYKTNDLISKLLISNMQKNHLLDIKELNHTYDGVHYTKEGHQIIFNKIKKDIVI